jgi:hypothetical protein
MSVVCDLEIREGGFHADARSLASAKAVPVVVPTAFRNPSTMTHNIKTTCTLNLPVQSFRK